MESDAKLLVALAAVLTLAVVYLLFRWRLDARSLGRSQASARAAFEEQVADLERQKRRGDEILERMAEGVLVLDDDLRPVFANWAARSLLGLQQVSLPPRLPSEEVVEVARAALSEDTAAEEVVNVWFPNRMSLRTRAAPLEDRVGVVVLLQDVSEELRTQRIRREFVAHASHELKSPVAGMQALAEALKQAVQDDPVSAERFSDRLISEADRMSRLIADLLDLSRLEETTTSPTDPVDLSEHVVHELDELRATIEAKGLSLIEDISPGIWVAGDGPQLSLMARNLIENAIRYTPAEGTISIDVSKDENGALFKVIDTGIGIPLEAQSRVFERFYRVDRARSRDRGGTGLGLSIVKHVAELHGGSVSVESELGRGSNFLVRIPSAAARQAGLRSIAG